MTKSFNKFKKTCFSLIFGPFSQISRQNFFSRKSGSVTHNLRCVSGTMPKFRKSSYTIPRKRLDRRTDRRTEGRTGPILQDPSGYRRCPKTVLTSTAHILRKANQYKLQQN